MRLPTISGIIDRRILANFRIDADSMAAALPRPFRPQLFDGWAIGGICLIRLKRVRPAFLPISWGIGSENAAHRIAVEWSENGETKHGVYIPRRDTNSRLNSWAGGTIFPGRHHHASFNVIENGEHYSVTMTSGDAKVHVSGTVGYITEFVGFRLGFQCVRFFRTGFTWLFRYQNPWQIRWIGTRLFQLACRIVKRRFNTIQLFRGYKPFPGRVGGV